MRALCCCGAQAGDEEAQYAQAAQKWGQEKVTLDSDGNLDLRGVGIQDEDIPMVVAIIKKNRGVRGIALTGTGINRLNDASAAYLAKVLSECQNLEVLGLST